MEYYSVIKENEMMPFAGKWMNLEIIILREISWTEKEKYHYDIFYMWNRKRNYTNELTNRRRLKDLENELMVARTGEGWGKG